MINFQKEINRFPEGMGRGNGGDNGTSGKVANVLEFGPKLDDKREQEKAEKPIRDFETFCRRFRNDHTINRIKRLVRVDEKGAYFMIDGKEIKIPFGLGDECSFEDANHGYDLELLLSIFRIFDPYFDLSFPNHYNDEPIFLFFKDVMRWSFGSYIWVVEQASKEDDDTQMYRFQGLTYDGQIVGGNIPEEDSGEDTENIKDGNKGRIIFFASNGIVFLDPQRGQEPVTTAFSFPR